jgi:hypothetical protein
MVINRSSTLAYTRMPGSVVGSRSHSVHVVSLQLSRHHVLRIGFVMVVHLMSKLISYACQPGVVGGSIFAPSDEGERLRYAGYALSTAPAEAMTCQAALAARLATSPGRGVRKAVLRLAGSRPTSALRGDGAVRCRVLRRQGGRQVVQGLGGGRSPTTPISTVADPPRPV